MTMNLAWSRRLSRIARLAAVGPFCLVISPPAMARSAPPMPVISILDADGMAPFTVHVNALDSVLGAGTLITGRYEWDFGDPSGRFNTLEGFNAAHHYRQSGVYTLTLRITNEAGLTAESSLAVTVAPDTRQRIYVSAGGHDANDGGSEGTPVRTIGRAFQMIGDDVSILLRRGDQFDVSGSSLINHANVLVSTYGTGSRPVLTWTAGQGYAGMFDLASNARDVVIERLALTSIHPAGLNVVEGVYPAGQNTTVRKCSFQNLSTAVNCNENPVGVLTIDNTAAVIGAYFIWGQGSDHVHLGNTVADSLGQHNMRFAGVDRMLIAYNDLTITNGKTCIWLMSGDYARIAYNSFHEGPVRLGPHLTEGPPSARARWLVVEGNQMDNHAFRVHHGSEHLMLRNNVVRRDNNHGFEIFGWSDLMQRTSIDVRVAHNTVSSLGTNARFITVHGGTEDVLVANNLLVAPFLETGTGGANAVVLDETLGTTAFTTNLWAEPAVVGWGDGWHYLWPTWGNYEGYQDPSEWSAHAQTTGELYRRFAVGDLDEAFAPQFDAAVGQAVSGVHVDLYGEARPLSGTVVVGAVVGGAGDDGGSGDANGDGTIDVDDIIELLTSWGQCPPPPAGCPDLNGDGRVDSADLDLVINNWP